MFLRKWLKLMRSSLPRKREPLMIAMAKRDYSVSISTLSNSYLAGSGGSGSTGGSFKGFRNSDFYSFQHAEDVFKNFFGGKDPFASFFDDDEDDFWSFGGFGGGHRGHQGKREKSRGR